MFFLPFSDVITAIFFSSAFQIQSYRTEIITRKHLSEAEIKILFFFLYQSLDRLLMLISLAFVHGTDLPYHPWIALQSSQALHVIQTSAISTAQDDLCLISCSHMVPIKKGTREPLGVCWCSWHKTKIKDKHQECLVTHLHFRCVQHQHLSRRLPFTTALLACFLSILTFIFS